MSSQLLFIPTETAQKYYERDERERLRKARNRYRWPSEKRSVHHGDKKFVMWDGEGPKDAGYALFGNSDGDELCKPFLSTEECFSLIINAKIRDRETIHIAFGFNYDVSMMIADLPERARTALHKFNRTVWKDWEIEHIPHKWFKIKRGQIVCKIYDIYSFFMSDYVTALENFHSGTEHERELIAADKKRRAEFVWADIENIKKYWRLELKLGPILAENLRDTFKNAGYVPRSWHGPGALARAALQRHKIYDAMCKTPKQVQLAAQYGFAGGRFEPFLAGHLPQPKIADIHSAYPYFATQLPNLRKGKWRHGKKFEQGKFAIYRIRYHAALDDFRPYPLFKRLKTGEVVWPHKTEGWYWSPEAELVAGDPDAKFLESWVFDEYDHNDRPFKWLEEYYRKRQLLKKLGNAAEYTFKLIINAVYGQLAQRAGWDRKKRAPPKSHQLEWAGYITSACRAAVYKLARQCGTSLISIDTDGVTSLDNFSGIDIGENLGQWELSEYEAGIFWQSGIYCLKSGNEWAKAKTRGIPKGSYSPEDLLDCLRSNQPLKLTKHVFIGYGLADNGSKHALNSWVDEPHNFIMGGKGKRVHVPRGCKNICNGDLHRLMSLQLRYASNTDLSAAHYLPWLDTREEQLLSNKQLMHDLTQYDLNDLREDENWVRHLA